MGPSGPSHCPAPLLGSISHTCTPARRTFSFLHVLCLLVFPSEPLQRLLPLPGSPSPWVRGNCIDKPCLPSPSRCTSSQLGASAGPSVFNRPKASQSLLWDGQGYAGPCCEIPRNLRRDTLGGLSDLCPMSLKLALQESANAGPEPWCLPQRCENLQDQSAAFPAAGCPDSFLLSMHFPSREAGQRWGHLWLFHQHWSTVQGPVRSEAVTLSEPRTLVR